MSGFVALFQRNGAPIDRGLLNALTSFLSFRGPDALEIWSSGPIGLGHTLLRTSRSNAKERQPTTFDGHCWIVADARLDRRTELRDQLKSMGEAVCSSASDAELILHSYLAWSDDCMKHLFGDFSFAIWDNREQRVFCARDHFGIRPFYYAETRGFFLCSNTLDCVRLHPGISDDLNDQAVADFLLFGLNCDKTTTTFQDIQRLPPAHFLSVRSDHLRTKRYWSPPIDGWIRYRRQEEYAEHFRENVRHALADRMDVDNAGILLSGGMDSGTLAALAKEISPVSNTRLKAYTVTYEKLLGDREGYFAQQTADYLDIPLEHIPLDGFAQFTRARSEDFVFPEPIDDPFAPGLREQFRIFAKNTRVILYGEGVDNLMHFQITPYLKALARQREWRTLFGAVSSYCWAQHSRWHRVWHRVIRRFSRRDDSAMEVPPWISPDFARRFDLIGRFRHFGLPKVCPAHPLLPVAHASLDLPQWPRLFEAMDTGFTQERVEVRYPFLDLRVVDYLLAIPPFPHFLRKKVERNAMKGKLPHVILRRPKTPLKADPWAMALRKATDQPFGNVEWADGVGHYVLCESVFNGESTWEFPYFGYRNSCIRPVCFNFWLQSSWRVRYKFVMETRNA